MSLGADVIDELASRRQLGAYFDYAGYRALRSVETVADMTAFLERQGYPNAPESEDAAVLADWLNATAEKNQSLLTWMAIDPLGGVLGLPLWLLFRFADRHSLRFGLRARRK